ncbi:hypothetical protein QEG73_22950 [Chitinophagaceae bacterium 26-R-25]|nr:hypothetical protein [Chitinophagaceae bacterium 26-R-25]
MIVPQKYNAVNWTDSMKVTKEHFIGNNNFLIDHLRDVASVTINKFNFGLLPPLEGSGAQATEYSVNKTASNQLQVTISYCQAITPGGVRISIGGNGLTAFIPLSVVAERSGNQQGENSSDLYYVVIVANPFERVLLGNPDPDESPIRQPFCQPFYNVELLHADDINAGQLGAYHLVIGRIRKKGIEFYKDEDFIPPCASVMADEKLRSSYKNVCSQLESLQNMSVQIVQKINYKNQKAPVAQNVKSACEKILAYMAQAYFGFRNVLHQQPPVYLVEAISAFSNVLHTFVQTLPENDKEELLNYFNEWSDISPVVFMSRLAEIVEFNYSHYDTGFFMKAIQQMLTGVVLIWNKLNSLEFIGQHKENIVVREEVISNVVKEKRGWSILD